MKKTAAGAVVLLLLCACSSLNKNTVSYQKAKWDASKYYVVAGDGSSKNASAQKALENMKKELMLHTPAQAQEILPDLMANASVKKTWRDEETSGKHYYSLAVLSRTNAHAVLIPSLDQLDTQLEGLTQQFSTPADPLADLKVAYKMQPLVQRRSALDEVYQFTDAAHQSYHMSTFNPYKNTLKQKMGAVLVGIEGEGNGSDIMATHIISALNKMGFGVVENNSPDKVLTVEIQTEVEGYNSKKVNGLVWCTGSATVSLIDEENEAVFSHFDVSQRAGTTRKADSLHRSMQAAGEQAAQEVAARLENYLKNK